MGLLDAGFDPQTQGLLAAAFAGLQASGPSRMPVSLGQIIGQAGTAGLNEYQQAMTMAQKKKQAEALMVLEQQKGELAKAQIEKMKAEASILSGLGGADMTDPDKIDALASKLMMVSPEKATALMVRSKSLREAQQESQTVNALRPTQGLIGEIPTQGVINGVPATRFNLGQNEPMVQPAGATEPIPKSVAELSLAKTPFVANPIQTGQLIPSPLMGGLLSSQAPGVASAAGGLTQMMANPAFRPKASLIEAQIEKLRASDAAAQNSEIARREGLANRLTITDAIAANRPLPNPPAPSVHIVKDASSSTGWGYKDFRTGVVTPEAPPPSSANADKRAASVRGRQISADLETATKDINKSLDSVSLYNEVRGVGDYAQASTIARDILTRAVRGGSSRLKSDVEALVGGPSGGNIVSRVENWVSERFSKGGGPDKETMAKIDKIMAATEEADLSNLANAYKRNAGKVNGAKLSVKEVLGAPVVRGTNVVFPDGTKAGYKTPEAAVKAAEIWMENN